MLKERSKLDIAAEKVCKGEFPIEAEPCIMDENRLCKNGHLCRAQYARMQWKGCFKTNGGDNA